MGLTIHGKPIVTPQKQAASAPLQAPKETLLTRAQAAKKLGVKPQTLASWASSKRYDLPYIKIGNKSVRYRESDIDDVIEAGTINPSSSTSNQQSIKKVDSPVVQTAPTPAQDPPSK